MSSDGVSTGRDPIPDVTASAPGPLSTGIVHVWFLDRTGPPDPMWLDILDEDERRRAMALRGLQRDAFTAAHALVRTALSAYGGRPPEDWRFSVSPQGRPSIVDTPGLDFSLTHSGAWSAVAIGTGEALGLDLEPIRRERDPLPLARRFFAFAETDWLAGLEPAECIAGFAALWTVKEAVLKARGCGLTESLQSVEVELGDSGRPVQVRGPDGPWAVRSWFPEPGWCAALAVQAAGPLEVRTFRARPLGNASPATELAPDSTPSSRWSR
jgi:4'-phosphopantetheinyl transferase